MSGALTGADPEMLHRLANSLTLSASQIDQSRAELSSAFDAVPWSGDNVERIRAEWLRQSASMFDSGEMLRHFAARVLRHQAEQEEASAAGRPPVRAVAALIPAAPSLLDVALGDSAVNDGLAQMSKVLGLYNNVEEWAQWVGRGLSAKGILGPVLSGSIPFREWWGVGKTWWGSGAVFFDDAVATASPWAKSVLHVTSAFTKVLPFVGAAASAWEFLQDARNPEQDGWTFAKGIIDGVAAGSYLIGGVLAFTPAAPVGGLLLGVAGGLSVASFAISHRETIRSTIGAGIGLLAH